MGTLYQSTVHGKRKAPRPKARPEDRGDVSDEGIDRMKTVYGGGVSATKNKKKPAGTGASSGRR